MNTFFYEVNTIISLKGVISDEAVHYNLTQLYEDYKDELSDSDKVRYFNLLAHYVL